MKLELPYEHVASLKWFNFFFLSLLIFNLEDSYSRPNLKLFR